MNYWDTQGIPFRPAVRVKPLAREWDGDFRCWLVQVRVTSQYERGTVRFVRASCLYQRQGVSRQHTGRLYWEGNISHAELMALPLVTPC